MYQLYQIIGNTERGTTLVRPVLKPSPFIEILLRYARNRLVKEWAIMRLSDEKWIAQSTKQPTIVVDFNRA